MRFYPNTALAFYKTASRYLGYGALSICLIHMTIYAEMTKATWYRYYDQKGTPNISSSVTQNHIRFGYEALDKNMQVIQRNKPYNVEKDIKQEPLRAQQAKQRESDQKLKNAYTSSQVAIQKRDATLTGIAQQLTFQKQQLNQLNKDRLEFKKLESVYLRKGEQVPQNIKDMLNNNNKNIDALKYNIQSLQVNYLNTQREYEQIIKRLKAMETK